MNKYYNYQHPYERINGEIINRNLKRIVSKSSFRIAINRCWKYYQIIYSQNTVIFHAIDAQVQSLSKSILLFHWL